MGSLPESRCGTCAFFFPPGRARGARDGDARVASCPVPAADGDSAPTGAGPNASAATASCKKTALWMTCLLRFVWRCFLRGLATWYDVVDLTIIRYGCAADALCT